jgi:hypothetical protein
VRVTFSNGRTLDLLQKAYPVGPYIVAGFAGSVRIGFQMLASLAKFLIVAPNAPRPGAWEPEWVAEHWKPIAFQIFATADTPEQAQRCEILLVGISNKIDPEALGFDRCHRLSTFSCRTSGAAPPRRYRVYHRHCHRVVR